MKNERVSAEYVSNRHTITAAPQQTVAMFEFWHINGTLKRQCVPIADSYNLSRLRSYEAWYEVGIGSASEPVGEPDEWGVQDWIVDLLRTDTPPPCPYTWRWRTARKLNRAFVVARLALRGRYELAWHLLRRGYIFGKSELVFMRQDSE